MNNNKISAELQNDIMRVLRGETKVEIALPQAIMEAAKKAAVDLKQLSLTEGYLSAESKKQVLRNNLNEGLKNCGCTPTADMITRYEEEAMKPVAPVAEEKIEENAEELDESSDMMLRSWIRNNYPKADNAKFNKIYAAMKKQHSKNPKAYTYGGGFSKVAKDAKIKEMVDEAKFKTPTTGVPAGAGEDKFKAAREIIKKAGFKAKLGKGVPAGLAKEEVEVEETETQITEELKNFVTNLTAEDRNILRGLLEAQD